MASGHSADEPLLPNLANAENEKPSCSTSATFFRWVLGIAMWVVFGFWVAVMLVSPLDSAGNMYLENWTKVASGSIYGITGSIFLVFNCPILVISFLAIASLNIAGEEELQMNKSSKQPRFRLRTFPILVDGPFGVVSAAEFIGMGLFILFALWVIYAYATDILDHLWEALQAPSHGKFLEILESSGLHLGSIVMFCLGFLFLPITRGSVVLRIIDVPFEQATQYHVWLGHLTMSFVTLHGLCYIAIWVLQGVLLDKILEWTDDGISNLPGVITLSAGLLMWATSMPPVRKKQFELFFYTHQLYVVFLLFLALHVGDFIFSIAAGGIFLFVIDRFLRFCQSHLRYNALSFIFLQIRELSWLQWHPFSVSSSPLAGDNRISILVKAVGEWTDKLKSNVFQMSSAEGERALPDQSCSKIKASIEGPYGHESPYHLTYENLILVAGGSGISPFLAILSDILHLRKEGKPCLPRNVFVIWAIKKSDELHLLSTLDMELICPNFSDRLNLEVCVYVTRESDPPSEEGNNNEGFSCSVPPPLRGRGMSVLVGMGDRMWSGLYAVSSVVGFAILMALLDIFYINPLNIVTWWYRGLLFVGCMLASVVIFGGPVIYLWHRWERRILAAEEAEDVEKDNRLQPSESAHVNIMQDNFVPEDRAVSRSIHYGARPNFEEIFKSVSERWGNVDTGVIVCGPATLRSSVAKQRRSQNLRRESLGPVFHFNSHSFDL